MSTQLTAAEVSRVARSRPRDAAGLRLWVRLVLGVRVPAAAHCAGHDAPMDYLSHVFFERAGGAREVHNAVDAPDPHHAHDTVVWANRGGGKTFYGAVATLLDLLFKPGVEVRILGGSMDQSEKMYGYLRKMLERPGLRGRVEGEPTRRSLRLNNGSGVELLAQSERSVRGHRVQKLRCDEVELFDRGVWDAAQFVTQSKVCGGVAVRGTVEALSTVHRRFGLMHELVGGSKVEGPKSKVEGTALDLRPATFDLRPATFDKPSGRRLFKWCVLDVMGRCGDEYACGPCELVGSCGGAAKRFSGFMAAADVLGIRGRSSRERFEAEMLCRYASRSDAVYPAFRPAVHVREVEPDASLTWVGGMDFGMRNPTVVLWAQLRPLRHGSGQADGRVRVEVIDEYMAEDVDVPAHLAVMAARPWPRMKWIGVDPAGHQRQSHTGLSTVELLKRAGYAVRSRSVRLRQGLDMVRRQIDVPAPHLAGRLALSSRQKEWRLGDHVPAPHVGASLVIHPRCRRLIAALAEYHFDPQNPARDEPVKDGPDHAADALRYLVVNMDGWGRTGYAEY